MLVPHLCRAVAGIR